jgi:hypothetical protein
MERRVVSQGLGKNEIPPRMNWEATQSLAEW